MTINKKVGIILLFLLLINGVLINGVMAQNNPFAPHDKKDPVTHELWLAPAAGYTPDLNALRFSAMAGNLVLNRAGAYIAFEKGLDTRHFTNIFGVILTVNKYIYLWGGVDLYTRRGVVHSWRGARKEAGVGLILWNDLLVNTGWSKTVGFSFSLGWKLPIRAFGTLRWGSRR